MPSTSATPNALNLSVGKGIFRIDRYNDTTGLKTGQYLHMGLVSDGGFTPSRETIEIKNSMTGANALYDEANIGVGGVLTLNCREIDNNNLALAAQGAVAAFTQGSGTAVDMAVATAVKLGYAIYLGKKGITSITNVKKAGGATLATSEYSVDLVSGFITILAAATTVVDGDSITWSGPYPAIASKIIHGLQTTNITVAVQFVSASDAKGPKREINFHKMRVSADQLIALLSDTYTELQFSGKLLFDGTQAAGEEYYSIREI